MLTRKLLRVSVGVVCLCHCCCAMTTNNITSEQIEIRPGAAAAHITPEFIRLPKSGQLCPYCGMTRSALNGVILPTPLNENKPPVRSFALRQKGARKGIRLIDYASLAAYIRANEDQAGTAA